MFRLAQPAFDRPCPGQRMQEHHDVGDLGIGQGHRRDVDAGRTRESGGGD